MSNSNFNFKIYQSKYAALLIGNPEILNIPCAHFEICFSSNVREILKYGSNGLHFSEHILWNVISRGLKEHINLSKSNASTYATGEMGAYGICEEEELPQKLKDFFEALYSLIQIKFPKEINRVYKIEQRRVTAETFGRNTISNRNVYPISGMFNFNPELIQSNYLPDYVWKILLEECELGKIIIMALCDISEKTIKDFENYSKKFDELWDNRSKYISQIKCDLPMYYAPPFSMIELIDHNISIAKIDLSDLNPIQKIMIEQDNIFYTYSFNSYIYLENENDLSKKINKIKRSIQKNNDRYLDYLDLNRRTPFSFCKILSSYRRDIKKKWVDELYDTSFNVLKKKYSSKNNEKILNALEKNIKMLKQDS